MTSDMTAVVDKACKAADAAGEGTEGTVYLVRLVDYSPRTMQYVRRWALFDASRTEVGSYDASKKTTIARWEFHHGKIKRLVTYSGTMRRSEMAMESSKLRKTAPAVAAVEDDPKFQAAFASVIAYAKDAGQDVATVLERMAKIEMVH